MALVSSIERFIEIVGRLVSLSIFLLIGVMMYEVLARYFFNLPTRWTYDMSGWLQVAYVFLGGAYALQKGYFVRVDVFYAHASPRTQAWIDLTFSTVLFALFAGVLAWRGFALAIASYAMNEVSSTGTWNGPVWPAKFMVPIGVLLLTLAWGARVARNALFLLGRGQQA